MDFLFVMSIGLSVLGIGLSILTLYSKNDDSLNFSVVISCAFISFVGFMNLSSLPINYADRKILYTIALASGIIPLSLNILKNKSKNIDYKYIKGATILSILINLPGLFL